MAHKDLTGLQLHSPFHFVQDDDPGAVGAGLWWASPALKSIFVRNGANTGWITIHSSGGTDIWLPSGCSTQDIDDACFDVAAGGTVYLPNETHVQTAHILLPQKVFTLAGHPGGLSVLEHQANIQNQYGSAVALQIRNGNTLRNFTIKARRDIMGTGGRMNGIVLGGGVSDTLILGLAFLDITATCIILQGDPVQPNNRILLNTMNQYWEQGVEVGGHSTNLLIAHNTMYTSSSNSANNSGQEPFGVFIGHEQTFGTSDGIYIVHNSIDHKDLPGASLINSHPIALQDGMQGEDWRYENIYVIGNTLRGGNAGVRVQNQRSGPWVSSPDTQAPCIITISGNDIGETQAESIRIEHNTADYVEVTSNTLRLRTGGPTDGWNAIGGNVLFHEVRNTIVPAA